MSEKTLAELIWDLRRQLPGAAGYYSCVAMLGARIARAEAAEAFAEIAAFHYETGVTKDVYENAERLLREYKAAREAVRKLEAGA